MVCLCPASESLDEGVVLRLMGEGGDANFVAMDVDPLGCCADEDVVLLEQVLRHLLSGTAALDDEEGSITEPALKSPWRAVVRPSATYVWES